jgi:hypothetical protein
MHVGTSKIVGHFPTPPTVVRHKATTATTQDRVKQEFDEGVAVLYFSNAWRESKRQNEL